MHARARQRAVSKVRDGGTSCGTGDRTAVPSSPHLNLIERLWRFAQGVFVLALLCDLSRVRTALKPGCPPTLGAPDRIGNTPRLEFSVVSRCQNVTLVEYIFLTWVQARIVRSQQER